MSLVAGDRLGAYEILGLLGVGGMGEVYRARDTKLQRDVAIKILPELFATDPDRLARFQREAHLLASLNHPNIAGIHGIEDSSGIRALVLEYVDGPTLADRIAEEPIPLDEALPIARQIAEALEAAHEHGIIHRDLKPANIKLRPDGTVKVLDFGLAKALDTAPTGVALSMSPTITSPALVTGGGVILGTAAYMSPEQARGKPVDRRTDIWAFGCVFYEMLTGRRPFDGDDVTDVVAAIVRAEPDWGALPTNSPPALVRLLRLCLGKNPRDRLRDIGDGLLEMSDSVVLVADTRDWRSVAVTRRVMLTTALLAAVAAGAALMWIVRAGNQPALVSRSPIAFSVDLPSGVILFPGAAAAVSSDGRSIVFIAARAAGRSRIWIRTIDDAEVRSLAGTDGALSPFWSPDSMWVGFFADGKLKRVRVAGGPVETICDVAGFQALGGTWNRDDVILFSVNFASGLQRVPATGGRPALVTTPDNSRGESGHVWPRFLPDGRRFAYTVVGSGDTQRVISIGSLDSMTPKALFAGDATPIFTPLGTAAFTRAGSIIAQPIDLTTLGSAGDSVVLVSGSNVTPYGGFSFNGAARTLVYESDVRRTTLAWFDRSGTRKSTVMSGVQLKHPALSPDGNTVAVERTDESGRDDIWLFDSRGAGSRLTTGPGRASDVIWSPDGRRLVFSRGDGSTLVELELSGSERTIVDGRGERSSLYSTDWHSNGDRLLYAAYGGGGADIWLMPLSAPEKAVPLVQTTASEHQARFSPNGRWIAYASDESGRPEIYVKPMPPGAGRWSISTDGGAQPMWRQDGRELFYIDLEGVLRSVAVETSSSTLKAATPQPLFKLSLTHSPFVAVRNDYVVSRDGTRFLVASVDPSDGARLNVVVDWETKMRK